MKVRALEIGYYDNKRRKVGDIFTLKPVETKDKDGKPLIISADKLFSSRWMEKIDGKGDRSRFSSRKTEATNVAKAAHEPSEEQDDVI